MILLGFLGDKESWQAGGLVLLWMATATAVGRK
jgi:hypothetical protein